MRTSLMAFDVCSVRFAHPDQHNMLRTRAHIRTHTHKVDVYTWHIALALSGRQPSNVWYVCNMSELMRQRVPPIHICARAHALASRSNEEVRLSRPLLFSIQRYARADATHPLKYEWVKALRADRRNVRVRQLTILNAKIPKTHPLNIINITLHWCGLEQTVRQAHAWTARAQCKSSRFRIFHFETCYRQRKHHRIHRAHLRCWRA